MLKSISTTAICLFVAALLAVAGSQNSVTWRGIPLFAMCIAAAFLLQWIAFIPAYLNQTERFYDLMGSVTYISLTIAGVFLSLDTIDHRGLLLASMVIIWSSRLGIFLFQRISKDGGDARFDAIKPKPLRFLGVWSLQGLWVTVTGGAAFAAIMSRNQVPLGWFAGIGSALWLTGFVIEVAADQQKRSFRATRADQPHPFIHSGLWAYSRHPNYFGEILLWFGVSIVAFPALSVGGYITLISPIFVVLLLSRVSGVPLLEKRADREFCGLPAYRQYKSQTPTIVPRLSRAAPLPSAK